MVNSFVLKSVKASGLQSVTPASADNGASTKARSMGRSNWGPVMSPQEKKEVARTKPLLPNHWTLRRNNHVAAVSVTPAIAAIGQIRSATSQNGISRRNTPRRMTMK